MGETPGQDTGRRALLLAAAIIVVIAGLKAAQSIIVPILTAAVVAMICIPAITWLQRRKVPDWAAVTLVFAAVLAAFGGLSVLVGRSVADFNDQLQDPTMKTQLNDRVGETLDSISDLLAGGPFAGAVDDFDVSTEHIVESIDTEAVLHVFGSAAGAAADLLSNTFFVVLTVLFILGEVAGFPRKMREAFGSRAKELGADGAVTDTVRDYIRIKTEVSLATGVFAGILCGVAGVDYALLWGLVAFLFNYVPTIGSLIAAAPPVLLAFIMDDVQTALWVAAGYFVINLVIGNYLEPKLMGRKLGLSSLVVWLSLVFWGWIWGPMGMLLSVPLTMLVKILLESSDDMRWLAVLLGPGGEHIGADDEEPQESAEPAAS